MSSYASVLQLILFLIVQLPLVRITSGVETPPMLLIVSFDGFRPDYLTTHKSYLENMQKVAEQGVRAPSGMKPCFTTKTFPNHFSIATGLYEEAHGIIDNNMYNPSKNPQIFSFNNNASDWWDNGISMPLWTLNEKKGRSSAVIMWPGGMSTYGSRGIKYPVVYNETTPWLVKVNMAFDFLTAEVSPANCVFLYFNEPDHTAHQFGPFANETLQRLHLLNNITGYILKKIQEHGIENKLNLMIVSDHGMANVPRTNQIQLNEIFPSGMGMISGTGPIVGIFPNQGKFDAAYDLLKKVSTNNNFIVYKKNEIPDSYHYKNSENVAPIVLLAHAEYQFITWNDTSMAPFRGSHGYNNSFPSMQALFLASGPVFLKNYTTKSFLNVHLYPLMCHILGLDPGPHNGSLDAISHILVKSNLKASTSFNGNTIGLIVSLVVLCVFIVIGVVGVMHAIRPKHKDYSLLKDSSECKDEIENDDKIANGHDHSSLL